MTTTTYKFYHPNGECRRIAFTATPSIHAVHEVVNDIAGRATEGSPRKLTYTDSEGDIVLIKTSQDVAEAESDAHNTGAKSVKIHIVGRHGHCGGGRANGNTDGNGNTGNTKRCGTGGPRRGYHPGAAWHGGRCGWNHTYGHGLFWRPQPVKFELSHLPDEWKDAINSVSNILGGFLITDDDQDGKKQQPQEGAGAEAAPPTTNADDAGKDEEASSPAPTGASTPAPAKDEKAKGDLAGNVDTAPEAADFTFVENLESEAEEVAPGRSSDDAELDSKAVLLTEMGFDLPLDVARKMIHEMNGRMDLIVRALVANGNK